MPPVTAIDQISFGCRPPPVTRLLVYSSVDDDTHTGAVSAIALDQPVTAVCPPPSASITQIALHAVWHEPVRTKAMRVPSGDHAGSSSSTAFVVSCSRPVPSGSIE